MFKFDCLAESRKTKWETSVFLLSQADIHSHFKISNIVYHFLSKRFNL